MEAYAIVQKETPVSIRVEDIGKRALTFNPIKIYEKQF